MKAIIVFVIICGGIYYYDEHVACNPKGSYAAKINWAGHGTCGE